MFIYTGAPCVDFPILSFLLAFRDGSSDGKGGGWPKSEGGDFHDFYDFFYVFWGILGGVPFLYFF